VWDGFLNEVEAIAAAVPYQVCVGNHEHYFNYSGYLHRFAMPASNASACPGPSDTRATSPPLAVNNLYHSYELGGTHWVAISTEHGPHYDPTAWQAQLDFLAADLASVDRQRTPWVVIIGHRPLYCSSTDEYDCRTRAAALREDLEPLLRQHKVDLGLYGHIHSYERSYPVFDGEVVATSYEQPAATVHLVVGSAGDIEGLTDSWEQRSASNAWSAVRAAELSYGRIHFASATELTFEMVRAADGGVLDSFTIKK